jgi:hypothetical protein
MGDDFYGNYQREYTKCFNRLLLPAFWVRKHRAASALWAVADHHSCKADHRGLGALPLSQLEPDRGELLRHHPIFRTA